MPFESVFFWGGGCTITSADFVCNAFFFRDFGRLFLVFSPDRLSLYCFEPMNGV